ncbi:RNA-binding protein 5-like [Macrosteles quadrilineatus]|uniref:RNA-binding protein 5-like n=1 Tax=Macrosteles quadrilineatus TaxID=74068 RepID=UPI0023E0AFA9|nr:RNA-binding protein 5-like [Macrosteles quadrilineatus]XP_054261987.1 RNA-binding protein 5-like [Macrosteles quadrilineatus]
MDRRGFDGGSAYYQRSDNPEEYSRQRDSGMSRDWESRGGRERDSWENSVNRFLDNEERRPRDRRSRSRSRERDRGRDRRRSSSRERRGYRGSPGRGWDDEKLRKNWNDEETRGRGFRGDRRNWDDESGKDRDFSNREWSSTQGGGQKDDWLEKVWGKSDGYESSNSSWNNDLSDLRNDWPELPAGVQPMQNRTIIIRGLAQHITENDIRQEIAKCGLDPSDIRMIRRKNGTSRGFAFVEFASTEEAVKCMELKNGELMLNNHYRAIMQFSLPKDTRLHYYSDWHCKCSAHNFKRRDICYKCGCTREDAIADEVSAYPTNTVLLRGLDTLTTEANVLEAIQVLSNLPIKSVRIGRDPVTSTSLGVCYIEMNYVMDATFLHNALLMASPEIDGKTPLVSYYKSDTASQSAIIQASKAGNSAVEAAQWSHQKTGEMSQYTLKDVSRLAEYSANLYAKTPEEKNTYLTYYQQYYHKLISEGGQISLPSDSSAENLAKPAASSTSSTAPLTEAPDGSGSRTYCIPDVSTYQYDKTSGYYYDPYTTLYYDANSQYYYNSKLAKFLYWDSNRNTFMPAPTAATTSGAMASIASAAGISDALENGDLKDDDKKIKDKTSDKDKVKVAKRIAKDMEKWAKTLNHKKEIAKQNLVAQQSVNTASLRTQGAADIGFAVLERKDVTIPSGMSVTSSPPKTQQQQDSLVAAYGNGSDSEEEPEETVEGEEKQHVDWSKLACLLCKRQFPSKDILVKHTQLSDLHKQNLNKWYKSRGLDPDDAQKRTMQYRDRAKERRLKYGEPDKPQPNKLKETYIKSKEATISYEEPTKMGIGSDNLGNKLLQKMGWQEGMGLGKKNQGRTTIIEAERRSATAGLGTKTTGVVPGPGETYKDCVRKMMYIRYQEIEENQG